MSLYCGTRRYWRTLASGKRASCVKPQVVAIHTLIASAFLLSRPSPAHEINHVNEDRRDNRPTNLEWVTKPENVGKWIANHPTRPKQQGVGNHSAKLTEADVLAIRALQGSMSGRAVGRLYGVAGSTISNIWSRRTWKHL